MTFWVVIVLITAICIAYIFRDEFLKKKFVVTIVKNLPLSMFKNDKKKVEDLKPVIEEVKLSQDSDVTKEVIVTLDENINTDISEEISIKEKIEDIAIEECIVEKDYIKEESLCNEEEIKENIDKEEAINEDCNIVTEDAKEIVYWTPKGKSYHGKNNCRTLLRSKVINSGTLEECDKEYKCEHCK